jgi:hypothetical protein
MENMTFNKNTPSIIYLKDDEIFTYGNTAYGLIYLKTTKKKFWSKWSRRCFFLTNKSISFWKQRKNRREKFKKIFFSSITGVSGLENVVDFDNNYLTFDIFYNKNYKRKKYTFKSYNIDMFSYIYQIIDRKYEK